MLSPLGCCTLAVLLLLITPSLADRLESIPSFCSNYSDLYSNIDKDLSTWKKAGISLDFTLETIKRHTAGHKQKGLAIGIYDGKAYVISNTIELHLKALGHHAGIFHVYAKAVDYVASRYGSSLPNVEFVFQTIDRPIWLRNETGINYPVMRFGKSPSHPDILVPNFHFYQKAYTKNFLSVMRTLNKKYPWEVKKPILFSRFTMYNRFVHPNDTYTYRWGSGGAEICKFQGTTTTLCEVRWHLVQWARNHTDVMDVRDTGHLAMHKHAQYKYLLHVDGQGLSSRLDQLLTLGSLVFKEESGYYGYYHHLLQPLVHYVPVWERTPDDILTQLDWAKRNDAKAHKIALAAQEFAERYLTAEGRACYWLVLLSRYAQLLTYTPKLDESLWQYAKPVNEFIEHDVMRLYQKGAVLTWEP